MVTTTVRAVAAQFERPHKSNRTAYAAWLLRGAINIRHLIVECDDPRRRDRLIAAELHILQLVNRLEVER